MVRTVHHVSATNVVCWSDLPMPSAPFDWLSFLDRNRIPYRDAGRNVSAGHIATHCPFCGDLDHGEHLSISLQGAGWRCWRNPGDHSGRSPVRLIMALTGMSRQAAVKLAGGVARAGDGRIASDVHRMLYGEEGGGDDDAPEEEDWPEHSRPIDYGPTASKPYRAYLQERGFERMGVLASYGIRYAIAGRAAGRIVFPVRDAIGNMRGWVARTISRKVEPRYLDHGDIKHQLLWYDVLARATAGHTLVICEGPFDAMKVRYLGERSGVMATCVFTSQATPTQRTLLMQLRGRFDRFVVMLDADNQAYAIRLASQLGPLAAEIGRLPGVKDPGELRSLDCLGPQKS
jgi:hypothetical protein